MLDWLIYTVLVLLNALIALVLLGAILFILGVIVLGGIRFCVEMSRIFK